MRRLIVSVAGLLGLAALFPSIGLVQQAQAPRYIEQRGGFDVSGPYQVDPNWPKKTWPAPGYIWGSQSGVYPESADRVFLSSRGEIELPKDLKIGPRFLRQLGCAQSRRRDRPGARLPQQHSRHRSTGKPGRIVDAVGFPVRRRPRPASDLRAAVDPERHVWVVDDMNHVIHKFTNDGKTKVFTLGEMGVFGPNDDLHHFNRPTMIDWLPDGTFFVSDGYANSRVVKFNKDGKPLLWWGSMAPEQEGRRVHGAARHRRRRRPPRYVSDRFNRQIQVFDENGIFLDKWPSGYCHSLSMSRDQHLWCYDGDHEQFIKYDLRGHIETVFGRYGTYPAQPGACTRSSADSEGNMYAAEVFGGRTQKFVPKPNANPRDLFFGRELAPKTPPQRISTVTMAAPTSRPSSPKPIPTRRFQTSPERGITTRAKSQMAGSGGMGSGVSEPPIAMTIKQSASRDRRHHAVRVRRAGRGGRECRGARRARPYSRWAEK